MNRAMRYGLALVLAMGTGLAEGRSGRNESLEVVPYGWFAGLGGDMTINGNKTHFVRDAGDLFENLDIGGSLSIVARNNKMILLGSIDYFELISSDVKVANQTGTLETTEILGLIAVGHPLSSSAKTSVDLLMGLQMLRMDNKLKLNGGGTTSRDTHIYDPLLILHIRQALTDRLYLHAPLSVGGYLGDSDLLYSADLQLLFKVTERFDVRGGYRIVGYDFEANNANKLNFYQAGWTLGLGIIF